MKIGIDISQIVYEGTGVATYVRKMVETLLRIDKKNDYVLFGSSFREKQAFVEYFNTVQYLGKHIQLVTLPIPPTLLSFLWNTLHVIPVEWFIGSVDVFWSSDWTQPPLVHAMGVTTIHDLIPLKFPHEMDSRIVKTHMRRLGWVKKECDVIFCDSIATKKDIQELLHFKNVQVVYPGV